jgi:WS/DGAT/MGAT family acyltransferase
MTTYHERLSAQDAVFLELENANTPLHIGATAIFDVTPIRRPDGTLPVDSIRAVIASRMGMLPRYRMRIMWTPISGHPVWIDDDCFHVRHHLQLVQLPPPGDARALDEVVTEFLSHKLDRGRPLWEILIVDGLENGRAAAVLKAHHALTDGVSGVDMMMLMLSLNPSSLVPDPPAWTPRPAPTPRELIESDLRHRASLSLGWLGSVREGVRTPGALLASARDRVLGAAESSRALFRAGIDTPLNATLGSNRSLYTLRVELDIIKGLKNFFGGTLNDVVVAIVAGALRRFLSDRGVPVDGIELRAIIPVSTRSDVERGTLGNKLAVLVAPLAAGEADVRKRIETTRETMEGLKSSKQALGVEVLTAIAELAVPAVMTSALEYLLSRRSANLMITNIRGPSDPFYCLEAPMLEAYPAPPLWTGQTLAVGVLSYGGFLHWGLVVDPDRLPDADQLVDAVRNEIAELEKLAHQDTSPPRRRRKRGAADRP